LNFVFFINIISVYFLCIFVGYTVRKTINGFSSSPSSQFFKIYFCFHDIIKIKSSLSFRHFHFESFEYFFCPKFLLFLCFVSFIIRYNTLCTLRVSAGVLYELENCEVELYHVLQIWVREIQDSFGNYTT